MPSLTSLILVCSLVLFVTLIPSSQSRSNLCPFTRQYKPYSRCVTCRTCPYTENSCCLDTHESVIQESLEVLGSTYWNCRLTILYYQECGKCSPESHLFVTNMTSKYLNYSSVYDTQNIMPMQFNQEYGIRLCKHTCEYIWNQCASVPIITYENVTVSEGEYAEGSENVVPEGMTKEEFCKDYPTEEEAKAMGLRCYSEAMRMQMVGGYFVMVLALVLVLLA